MDTPTSRELDLLLRRLHGLAHATAQLLVQSPLDIANTAAREFDRVLDPLLTQLGQVRRDRVALAVDAARRAQRCWTDDPMTPTTVKIAASRLLISASALTLSDAAARRIAHRTPRPGPGNGGTAVEPAEPVGDRRAGAATRRYEQVRDVLDELQRELLPSGLPVLPGVRVAAAHLPADHDTGAGDWFDAIGLADGRLALVVGDVVGQGVAALVTMGKLRSVLHERLTTTGDLVAALGAVDDAAERIRGARATTVCVVVLDPPTGGLEYCTAGHPAPLVVSTRGGPGRYLVPTGAGPLGVGARFTTASTRTDSLTADELVLLYTDGILERPGRELAGSTVELAQAVGDLAAGRFPHGDTDTPGERVCAQLFELLTRDTGHDDDIVLLTGQPVAPPPDLAMGFAATEESLPPLHEHLREWLTSARVGDRDADALRHAAMELATNAIEHAYIDTAAEHHGFTLAATLTEAGQVRLQVTDQGRWREPAPSEDRGLGLLISEQLVDSLLVAHDEQGTRATVVHQVSRPARSPAPGAPSWTTVPRPAHTGPLLVLEQPWAPRPRLRLDGPVDTTTVAEADRGVVTAGSTGTRSLTVDLTGVTHLASAGVSALHRLAALHRANGTELRLYAPIGTTAEMVLSLVALEHHTHDPDYPDSEDD